MPDRKPPSAHTDTERAELLAAVERLRDRLTQTGRQLDDLIDNTHTDDPAPDDDSQT